MHNKLWVLFFLVLGGGFLYAHVHTSNDVRYPTNGTTIVAFGDSLVEGVGATQGNSFVDILSQRINTPIINMGVSGDTSADGLARINDVIAQDPRVVILVLGGNDALRQTPPEETFSNLRSIIETLQAHGVAVLLVAEPGGISFGREYEKRYKNLAKEKQLLLVPNILKGLLGKSVYMTDTIHPNDAGNVLVADKIEPSLRKLIEK
jgi:acyl-CoA thioesterase I